MSLLQSANEPGDLLKKLFREANGIVYEYNQERLSDLVVNFSVTANSMRDWCIKYLNQESDKKNLVLTWDSIPCLKAAKDIANANKHFTITMYTPTVANVNKSASSIIEFRSNQDIAKELESAKNSEEKRNEMSIETPSYEINFTDGSSLSLYEFYSGCIREWLSYFDTNGIPRNPNLNSSLIYWHRSQWPNLA
tara:strand:- start:58 stop:639 length:582 start_codon:yes stop_codon:yes gene_type:complete